MFNLTSVSTLASETISVQTAGANGREIIEDKLGDAVIIYHGNNSGHVRVYQYDASINTAGNDESSIQGMRYTKKKDERCSVIVKKKSTLFLIS